MKKLRKKYLRLRLQMLESKMSLPFIISITSLLFGGYLLYHPHFLAVKNAYEYVNRIFDHSVFAWLFILVSLAYVATTILKKYKVKKLMAYCIFFLWLVLFFSFLFREFGGYPTAGWVLILGTLLLINFELKTGDYR